MKNKTKYQICAVVSAILCCASLVLLVPPHRTVAANEDEGFNAESVYKFIFDMRSGNLDGAERAALAMPLSPAAMRCVHRIICHARRGELTDTEKAFISAVAEEDDVNNAIAEIENAAETEIKTVAEDNERAVSDAVKAAMEILRMGVRLSHVGETPSENIICLGRENMYLEMDKREKFILFLRYDCTPAERMLSREECEGRAMSFILRNMPGRYSAARPRAEFVCERGGCDCFIVHLGDKSTWVKIRCDTGSVVLFCGYGMELR